MSADRPELPEPPRSPRAGRRWRLRRADLRAALDDFRLYLSRADALAGLCLLGIVAGLVTGVVIVAFRLLSDWPLVLAGLMPSGERFDVLDWQWRLGLPIVGGFLIGLLFQSVSIGAREVGPVHVMAQLASNGGRMPWRNAVLQFFGGAMAIVAGHSVGREGPVIHVGAASASLLGQWMGLPNNSIRTLVACGVAGAIAALFNTPIAGVVFAMEVVMLEYTLLGFAPVILAAVAAASLSQLAYGPDPAFAVPDFQMVSLLELPWIVLLGLVIGGLAAAFVAGVRQVDLRARKLPLVLRTTLAGAFCGACALVAPDIMGLGYDTVQASLLGTIGLASLVLIVALKLAASIACGGLGVPGGLIGPMIVMGATAGAAIGTIGHGILPGLSAQPGFYAALGMVAMMGASLQAPLAALMAILELTGRSNTIMPGMVAVITAFLVARVVFRQESMFVAILRSRGMDFRFDPVAQALDRTGVGAVMSRRFGFVEAAGGRPVLDEAPEDAPDWLVVVEGESVRGVVGPSQLAGEPAREGFPAFATVALHATLREVLAQLDAAGADVALVLADGDARRGEVRGVVSRAQVESGVRYGF